MKLYYNVEFESLNVKIDYTYHVKTWHVKAGDQLGWIGSHSNFGFQHWRIRLFDSGSTLQRRSKNSEWVYSTHLFVHIWRLPKLLYYRIRVIIGWLVWSRREFKPPDYHHYYSNKMSLLMLALHCIYNYTLYIHANMTPRYFASGIFTVLYTVLVNMAFISTPWTLRNRDNRGPYVAEFPCLFWSGGLRCYMK